MMYFNMAPEETRMLEQAPPFNMATAEISIKRFELYFATMKYSDSASMARIAITRGDDETKQWIFAMGEFPKT